MYTLGCGCGGGGSGVAADKEEKRRGRSPLVTVSHTEQNESRPLLTVYGAAYGTRDVNCDCDATTRPARKERRSRRVREFVPLWPPPSGRSSLSPLAGLPAFFKSLIIEKHVIVLPRERERESGWLLWLLPLTSSSVASSYQH